MKPDLPDRLLSISETVSEWDAPITAAEDLREAAEAIQSYQEPKQLRQKCVDLAEENRRLRMFRDAVVSSITEHAGAGQEYAYIWQIRWDEIKAATAAGGKE